MNETERAFSSLLQRVNELERIVGEMKTAENPVQWDGSAVTIQQTAWIVPTFAGTWANLGSGYLTAAYRKDSLGVVHLRGLVASGTVGTVIFTLPVGYRPTAASLMSTVSYNGSAYVIGRVDVDTNGNVIHAAGGTAMIALDNLRFTTF